MINNSRESRESRKFAPTNKSHSREVSVSWNPKPNTDDDDGQKVSFEVILENKKRNTTAFTKNSIINVSRGDGKESYQESYL